MCYALEKKSLVGSFSMLSYSRVEPQYNEGQRDRERFVCYDEVSLY